MIVALLALFVGGVLLYAGITGQSVGALLRGRGGEPSPNRSLK